MDTSEFNSRGLLVIGAAVVVTVILLAVVPKNGALGGVDSGGSSGAATGTTFPSVTTAAPVTTTGGATATTKKGSSATTTTVPRPTVKLGSTGADVTYLQTRLIALGYLTGTADGVFGTGTQAAVIKFQQAKNINPANGEVGAATWAALG